MRSLVVVVCLLAGLVASGCGMSVTPPASLDHPVEVYIADHGIHTSLVLPSEDGGLTQFTYSRFDWAALDQDQWYRSLPAIMVPGSGTIGTREFPGPQTLENLAYQFELTNNDPPMEYLYSFRVSAETCRAVHQSLEERWSAAKDTAVFNKKRGMTFVRDSTQYSLFHNCNCELAGWLKSLGCRVDGMAMTADVNILTPREESAKTAAGPTTEAPTP